MTTPGSWIDRLATEVEHRLAGTRVGEILLWTGEDTGAAVATMLAVPATTPRSRRWSASSTATPR